MFAVQDGEVVGQSSIKEGKAAPEAEPGRQVHSLKTDTASQHGVYVLIPYTLFRVEFNSQWINYIHFNTGMDRYVY